MVECSNVVADFVLEPGNAGLLWYTEVRNEQLKDEEDNLELVFKLFDPDGAQVGADVAMTLQETGVYVGTWPATDMAVAEGYTCEILGKLAGTQVVKTNPSVIVQQRVD